MTRVLTLKSNVLVFTIPLILILALWGLTRSSIFQSDPQFLSYGIVLDLLITVPVIYFLLIRGSNISNYTVVSLWVVCLLIGGAILPLEYQLAIPVLKKFGIPILELGIFTLLIIRIRNVLQKYNSTKRDDLDFYDALKISLIDFPKVLKTVILTEASVIYYNLFGWRKRSYRQNEFTYHRKNGINLTLSVFIFLLATETFALHVLAAQWSEILAWILTFVSIYTALQITATMLSFAHRPVLIDHSKEMLYLRYGFFSESAIPFKSIVKLERTKRTFAADDFVQLSPFGPLDTHNLVIHVNEPLSMTGAYGKKKAFRRLAIQVDEIDVFLSDLRKRLDLC